MHVTGRARARLRRQQDRRRGQRADRGATRATDGRTVAPRPARAASLRPRHRRPRTPCWRPRSPERPLAAVGAATFGIPSDDGVDARADDARLERTPPRPRAARGLPRRTGPSGHRRQGGRAGRGRRRRAGRLRSGHLPEPRHRPGRRDRRGRTVLTGRHGAAGEIGYNLRVAADVGLPATERLPLEEAVSGMAPGRARPSALLAAGHRRGRVFAGPAADSRLAGAASPIRRRAGLPPGEPGHRGRSGSASSWAAAWCGPGTGCTADLRRGAGRRGRRSHRSWCRPRFPFDAPLLGAPRARPCAPPVTPSAKGIGVMRHRAPAPQHERAGSQHAAPIALAHRGHRRSGTGRRRPRGTASAPAGAARSHSSGGGIRPAAPPDTHAPHKQGGTVTISNEQGQTWTCQFNPFNPAQSTWSRSASSTSRWSSSTCCNNQAETPMLAVLLQVERGQEVDRLHHPRTG